MKTLMYAAAMAVVLLGTESARAEKIDVSPLPLKTERAFANLRLKLPVVMTHAGDGSDRIFIAGQLGVIHVIPNDQAVKKTKAFLDITKKVTFKEKQNEEGLLGLAFHPKYKKNGQFFVYYTTAGAPHTSVVSRFRVSSDDPNRADPASEEELLRIKQPYWNHNGGTLAFGPDGYLYIGLGDGGAADDPKGNGQNLKTLLGSILRIDVDSKSDGKKYGIPKDNPFVGRKDARPEIYAYGFRNVWRLSFDAPTKRLWAADVGQNLWEEINLVKSGGNYGWNIREAKRKFVAKGTDRSTDTPPKGMTDPIWEYHHDQGKSITGGHVYRGKRIPELAGAYLYADYVSGKIWALWYDEKTGQVTANRSIQDKKMPVITFGRDQSGEVYFTDAFGMIYRFAKK